MRNSNFSTLPLQPHRMLGVLGSHGGGSGSGGEGDPVQALAFCSRQQLLASAGLDDMVCFWTGSRTALFLFLLHGYPGSRQLADAAAAAQIGQFP